VQQLIDLVGKMQPKAFHVPYESKLQWQWAQGTSSEAQQMPQLQLCHLCSGCLSRMMHAYVLTAPAQMHHLS